MVPQQKKFLKSPLIFFFFVIENVSPLMQNLFFQLSVCVCLSLTAVYQTKHIRRMSNCLLMGRALSHFYYDMLSQMKSVSGTIHPFWSGGKLRHLHEPLQRPVLLQSSASYIMDDITHSGEIIQNSVISWILYLNIVSLGWNGSLMNITDLSALALSDWQKLLF